ncbi:hypothetical protein PBI_NAZO_46 [Mycobacterium phage Nazo]|uniref:Uncharacterized protein n=1 Tax=Mycobacterium phage Nazo TaxID=1897547 RepID=A0A1D8EV21_9CAUD|nr:hypothetical protein PBI_NAZO_46 [Mycobacterium phage Nazo]
MSARRPSCPVCWQPVSPTTKAKIAHHFDAIREDVCPASGEPYRITLEHRPEFAGVTE